MIFTEYTILCDTIFIMIRNFEIKKAELYKAVKHYCAKNSQLYTGQSKTEKNIKIPAADKIKIIPQTEFKKMTIPFFIWTLCTTLTNRPFWKTLELTIT